MPAARLLLLVACGLAASACSTTAATGRYALQVEQGQALAVPDVRQASRADCGMAALASVMAYYAVPAPAYQELLEQFPPAEPGGYSLGELRRVARAHGFNGFVVPGDMAFLRKHLSRGRPLIVPLQLEGAVPLLGRAIDTGYDHYVVVVGLDEERRKVITMDPARGPVEVDFDDFGARWEKTNHAVLLVGLAAAS